MTEIKPDLEALFAGLPAESRRRLERFDRMLAAEASVRGYIAPASASRSWHLHILDSLSALPLLDSVLGAGTPARIVDVGSGAGLPGIPLAIARPCWQLTLIEERGGRARLLGRFASELGLENASPRQADAARDPGGYDAAVARALARPPRALALCRQLVHGSGVAVLYLTCDQLADWTGSGGPEPTGVARYRLPGLRAARVAAAYPAVGDAPKSGAP